MFVTTFTIQGNSGDDEQTENDDSISGRQHEALISGSKLEAIAKEALSSSYDKVNVGQEDHCQLSTNSEGKSLGEHKVCKHIHEITSKDVLSSISEYKRSKSPRKIKSLICWKLLLRCCY